VPSAELLARLDDLLHPDVQNALGRDAAQITRRVGKAVDVVDAEPVHQPALDELEDRRMRPGEDLVVLDAHARQLADVEEATVRAGLRVDVEDLPPTLRIGPERIRVVHGHVVRDHVQDDAEPRGAGSLGQFAEPLRAAQIG
jgi:hypothetical protein